MIETKRQRKKTGPKPLYGEAKKMVSFRLSPEALNIIKALADEQNMSQAEVLERWARDFKNQGVIKAPDTVPANLSAAREFAANERV